MNKVILQDHAEFMQLYDIQKGHNDRVSTIVDQRIADAEARDQEEQEQPHHQHQKARKQQNKRQKFKLKKHEYAKQQQTL